MELMMMRILILVSLAAGVASANVYPSKAGKVSIDIPSDWKVTAKDDLVRAASANNEIALVMWVVDKPEVKAALTKLESELYSSIRNLKWVDKTKAIKVNKLKGTWVEGVGMSGRGTQLDVLVVVAGPTANKKGIILFAVVDHDKLAANQKTIRTIFETLKPTK